MDSVHSGDKHLKIQSSIKLAQIIRFQFSSFTDLWSFDNKRFHVRIQYEIRFTLRSFSSCGFVWWVLRLFPTTTILWCYLSGHDLLEMWGSLNIKISENDLTWNGWNRKRNQSLPRVVFCERSDNQLYYHIKFKLCLFTL